MLGIEWESFCLTEPFLLSRATRPEILARATREGARLVTSNKELCIP